MEISQNIIEMAKYDKKVNIENKVNGAKLW